MRRRPPRARWTELRPDPCRRRPSRSAPAADRRTGARRLERRALDEPRAIATNVSASSWPSPSVTSATSARGSAMTTPRSRTPRASMTWPRAASSSAGDAPGTRGTAATCARHSASPSGRRVEASRNQATWRPTADSGSSVAMMRSSWGCCSASARAAPPISMSAATASSAASRRVRVVGRRGRRLMVCSWGRGDARRRAPRDQVWPERFLSARPRTWASLPSARSARHRPSGGTGQTTVERAMDLRRVVRARSIVLRPWSAGPGRADDSQSGRYTARSLHDRSREPQQALWLPTGGQRRLVSLFGRHRHELRRATAPASRPRCG